MLYFRLGCDWLAQTINQTTSAVQDTKTQPLHQNLNEWQLMLILTSVDPDPDRQCSFQPCALWLWENCGRVGSLSQWTEYFQHGQTNKTTVEDIIYTVWVLMLCRPANQRAKPQAMFHQCTAHLCIGKCYAISAKWFMRAFWHPPAHPNHTHLLRQKEETTHTRITLREKSLYFGHEGDVCFVKDKMRLRNTTENQTQKSSW